MDIKTDQNNGAPEGDAPVYHLGEGKKLVTLPGEKEVVANSLFSEEFSRSLRQSYEDYEKGRFV